MEIPVFFVHPPKCGGSSVTSFFDLNYGFGKYQSFEESLDGFRRESAHLMDSGVGGGHHAYGIHQTLKYPLQYCTILRDPLERQISHYWYARNGKNGEVEKGAAVSFWEAMVRRGSISLDEWVSESIHGQNIYLQYLSGRQQANDESFDAALMNINENMIAVGVVEQMSAFLLQLCAKLRLKYPFYITRNTTKPTRDLKEVVSSSAKKRFFSANTCDYKLYKAAMDSSNRKSTSPTSLFSKALDSVKEIQLEINQIDNPMINSSFIFGEECHIYEEAINLIVNSDLSAIEQYLEPEWQKTQDDPDLYCGHVDGVSNDTLYGWVCNLTQPEEKVLIEVRSGGVVVNSTLSGIPRDDVARAGYPSKNSGFSIPLGKRALSDGFEVVIANSTDLIRNGGFWKNGWHVSRV